MLMFPQLHCIIIIIIIIINHYYYCMKCLSSGCILTYSCQPFILLYAEMVSMRSVL